MIHTAEPVINDVIGRLLGEEDVFIYCGVGPRELYASFDRVHVILNPDDFGNLTQLPSFWMIESFFAIDWIARPK